MNLLHTASNEDRKANIWGHGEQCYVVEFYIGNRLFKKMNVMETLVDTKHIVETFLNEGRNQQLLNENV